MDWRSASWIGILAGAWLGFGCGGGGGGTPATSIDLSGAYSYSLTPGTVTGNGALDCYASEATTGTVDVTWTTGSSSCQVAVDGAAPVTAHVSGNTITYSKSATNYLDCDAYQESVSIHMTSATAGSGAITWHCSWTSSGTAYSCSAQDTLAITRD